MCTPHESLHYEDRNSVLTYLEVATTAPSLNSASIGGIGFSWWRGHSDMPTKCAELTTNLYPQFVLLAIKTTINMHSSASCILPVFGSLMDNRFKS